MVLNCTGDVNVERTSNYTFEINEVFYPERAQSDTIEKGVAGYFLPDDRHISALFF